MGGLVFFCGFDHDVSLTDIKMDPNPDMIEDLPLKMKAIKMLNPRKDDNKSVYFIQNFKIESPNPTSIFGWKSHVKIFSKKNLKIAKTQDFMWI